jgi:glutamate-1-semialdehyde 2,1-aminomutase
MAKTALSANGIAHQIVGDPTLFEIVFADTQPRDYRDTFNADTAMGAKFNAVLMQEGVFKAPGKTYPSLALTEADFELTQRAYEIAAASLA